MNFILTIPAMVWLIVSAVFFAGGEFLSKKFALNPSLAYLLTFLGLRWCAINIGV